MRFNSGFLLMALLLMSTTPGVAASGTIALTGNGSATSAPEYVSYSIRITSICYNTSLEASSANAKIANEVLAVLEGFKKQSRDKVTATGGVNILRTETIDSGSEPRIICEKKWHAENHLEIQMADFADLPDLQDKLLGILNVAAGVDEGQVAQTYAEVGQPEFRLYPGTSTKLHHKAQARAFDDAKSQLGKLQSRCDFVGLKLIGVTAPEYSFSYKMAGDRSPENSGTTPLIPDEIEIGASLRMQWTFRPSPACGF